MSTGYEIIIRGHLSKTIIFQLGDIHYVHLPQGDTQLIGSHLDQAALYGIMNRCRDFGLTLVAINPTSARGDEAQGRLE